MWSRAAARVRAARAGRHHATCVGRRRRRGRGEGGGGGGGGGWRVGGGRRSSRGGLDRAGEGVETGERDRRAGGRYGVSLQPELGTVGGRKRGPRGRVA